MNAMLVRQLLSQLCASARQREPAPICPTNEATIERQGLPRSPGRRKVDVSRAMAPVVRDRLHSAAHPDPGRTWWGRTPSAGRYSKDSKLIGLTTGACRLLRSTLDRGPGRGHDELERRPIAVA